MPLPDKTCQCEGCRNQLQRALDFGRIFEELERPNLLEQLTELNQPYLEDSALKIMLAVWRALEIPELTDQQRLKIFRFYYKEPKIEPLDMGTEPIESVKWVEL